MVFPLQLCLKVDKCLVAEFDVLCLCARDLWSCVPQAPRISMLLGAKVFVVGLLSMPCCNIVGREKQHVRGWGQESVSEADLQAFRSFFPSSRGGCASVVFASDPLAPPIFQCCLQAVTANLLRHVRKTTLTSGGAGMGLQFCNFCPASAPLANRRVAPSAKSNPQQCHSRAWIWGRFLMGKLAPLGRGLRGTY